MDRAIIDCYQSENWVDFRSNEIFIKTNVALVERTYPWRGEMRLTPGERDSYL